MKTMYTQKNLDKVGSKMAIAASPSSVAEPEKTVLQNRPVH
jgi:hypothetical protein